MKIRLLYIDCFECICRRQHMVVFQITGLGRRVMTGGAKGRSTRNQAKGKDRRKLTTPQHVPPTDQQHACLDHGSDEECFQCCESDDDESSGNSNESGASEQVTWGWNSGSSNDFLGHFQV